MKNIALYARKINKINLPVVDQLLSIIKKMGWTPILEKNFKAQLVAKAGLDKNTAEFSKSDDFKSGIDLALSIGGDGTFIQMVKYIRDSGVPILGINLGRLGFLSGAEI